MFWNFWGRNSGVTQRARIVSLYWDLGPLNPSSGQHLAGLQKEKRTYLSPLEIRALLYLSFRFQVESGAKLDVSPSDMRRRDCAFLTYLQTGYATAT